MRAISHFINGQGVTRAGAVTSPGAAVAPRYVEGPGGPLGGPLSGEGQGGAAEDGQPASAERRHRALIGLRVYSFARIGAALGMAVEDVYTQNRRLWMRLREKGGKRHAMPCHNRVRNVPLNGGTHGGSANCSLYRMAEIVAVTRSMT